MFFLQDDHDHFDNDEATDEIITFPPTFFMVQLARATQNFYYPEFLPEVARPLGLPWSSMGDRVGGVSESFGTIRYGRLAEFCTIFGAPSLWPVRAPSMSISKWRNG